MIKQFLKKDKFYFLDVILLILVSIIISLFILKSSLAWTNPTSSPPLGGPSSLIATSTIIFFNGTTCPLGWTEVTNARGRYIVGLPASGSLAGTAGTALTDLENRNLGTHTHTASAVNNGHTHSLVPGACSNCTRGTGSGSFTSGGDDVTVTVNALTLPAGTPSPYIQLLVCQKS